jgi:hypothetical protein
MLAAEGSAAGGAAGALPLPAWRASLAGAGAPSGVLLGPQAAAPLPAPPAPWSVGLPRPQLFSPALAGLGTGVQLHGQPAPPGMPYTPPPYGASPPPPSAALLSMAEGMYTPLPYGATPPQPAPPAPRLWDSQANGEWQRGSGGEGGGDVSARGGRFRADPAGPGMEVLSEAGSPLLGAGAPLPAAHFSSTLGRLFSPSSRVPASTWASDVLPPLAPSVVLLGVPGRPPRPQPASGAAPSPWRLRTAAAAAGSALLALGGRSLSALSAMVSPARAEAAAAAAAAAGAALLAGAGRGGSSAMAEEEGVAGLLGHAGVGESLAALEALARGATLDPAAACWVAACVQAARGEARAKAAAEVAARVEAAEEAARVRAAAAAAEVEARAVAARAAAAAAERPPSLPGSLRGFLKPRPSTGLLTQPALRKGATFVRTTFCRPPLWPLPHWRPCPCLLLLPSLQPPRGRGAQKLLLGRGRPPPGLRLQWARLGLARAWWTRR